MGTRQEGQLIVDALTAGGVRATTNVRSAVPPCVLVTPPVRRYDLNTGYSIEWRLVALAPGVGTADAWDELDRLVDAVDQLVDVERAEPGSYTLPDAVAVPAYILTVTGAK